MIQDFNKYFRYMRRHHKDNDKRATFETLPCIVCDEFCSADIDNPPFEEKDWQEFWRMSKENYPLHSVYGGALGDCEDTIMESEAFYAEKHLKMIRKNLRIKDKSILEIGYGFGGAGLYFIDKGADYTGIDYVSSNPMLSKDYFREIKTSGIPEDLIKSKKFDIIYSFNVFQHLTQAQRFEYIKQAYEVLNDGGILFFSVFERIPGHGLRDTYSTTFFNVHTKIDEPEELRDFLHETGFTFKRILEHPLNEETNDMAYICKKKTA